MVRGVYIQRAPAERMAVEAALARDWLATWKKTASYDPQ
ncbi:hypothetical protein L510_0503 [Bordetella bronchiseptica MBORD591]|nr:hypothetical protein L510_0503 [Bordetella bronchiseptica MBORD591]